MAGLSTPARNGQGFAGGTVIGVARRTDRPRRSRVPSAAAHRRVRLRGPRGRDPEQGDEPVVVASARCRFAPTAIPLDDAAVALAIVINLLGGSLVGAWLGAGWAMRLHPALYRVIAMLLCSSSCCACATSATQAAPPC